MLLCGCQAGADRQPDGSREPAGIHGTAETKETEEIPELENGPGQTDGVQDGITPDYIFPDSDKKIIFQEDVEGLTQKEIRLARNEIYARHGRGFQSQELQAYFDGKPWYKKTIEPDGFNESLLNEYEKRNIRYLKGLEPVEGLPDLPVAVSKQVIDSYGYVDGHSLLSFELKPGTAEDCGGYYQVDAVYSQGIEAPGDLKPGDRVTLVFNELTGETKTLERREDGLYSVEEGVYSPQYYYSPTEDGGPVVLYQDSDDRVDKPVYEGKLFIRKDATIETDIDNHSAPVTFEKLNDEYNGYNGIFFDEKGYAVRLVFYGD